ncbi:Tfp pilus assembly protein FimV [Andreprevotia lacus DSM 23236]|jgi:hypothetical protein|uniref:Tfp pilus assembly protein FimV n=1 Tax=Andreprevotia lacus DSM 23236 TaxID=1121001 RepID=A0A1W1XLP6_9NEIS|nr:hypothetical protein [Andreprevotia lacus]SMC24481.1 Tfp pilus assembly protein FimV [Andreprevotia lacus DSM 23236]
MKSYLLPAALAPIVLATGLGLSASVHAAMLGEMQVRSALGERFQASVSVAGADDEKLNSSCFRLVTPQQLGDDDLVVLRKARLLYQPDDEFSGRLLIYGEEKIDEPLLSVAVRVKCPDEDRRVFQRDYSVMLDPREYKSPVQHALPTPAAPRSGQPASRRSVPALGSVWITRDGESVDQIAKAYFPNDKAARARFVDALFLLNPDLPQGTQARLQGDTQIRLPDRLSVQPETKIAEAAPARPLPQMAPATMPTLPPLRIESASPQAAPVDENRVDVGEGFRLRLSSPTLDTTRKSELSPEQSLRVREHLLSLSSDDQTAQLLQLKYQISELEKQLAAVKSHPVDASPVQDAAAAESRNAAANGVPSWWWLLLPLALAVGLFVWLYRRWQQRREYEEAESFSFATNFEAQPAMRSASTQTPSAVSSSYAPSNALGMRDLVQNISRAATEFHNDEVDVVQPNNVSDEAQLLIDHGLTQQAINLLDHELGQHPTALALWMKLFDIHRDQGMKQAFQERAVAFRLQFASDALWQQVQASGRMLDPDNPLYRSLDDQPDDQLELTAPPLRPVSDPGQDALDFASMMHQQAGLAPPDAVVEQAHVQAHDQDAGFEAAVPHALTPLEVDEPPPSLPGMTFDIQSQDIDVIEMPVPDVTVTGFADIDLKQFVSDDEQLQRIARLLAERDLDTACHLLEEMLYHGTLDQRMMAMKWLDKLAPVRGL